MATSLDSAGLGGRISRLWLLVAGRRAEVGVGEREQLIITSRFPSSLRGQVGVHPYREWSGGSTFTTLTFRSQKCVAHGPAPGPTASSMLGGLMILGQDSQCYS